LAKHSYDKMEKKVGQGYPKLSCEIMRKKDEIVCMREKNCKEGSGSLSQRYNTCIYMN